MGVAPSVRASIDIGTNSVLLLVADVRGGALRRIEERATITRLGKGVDATRRLDPDAIARTLDVLREYAERVRHHRADALRVAATSAVRDATNRDEFVVPAQEILGAPVETISGEDEARLTFQGAVLGLPLAEGARVVTFDIGGGSTEVIAGTLGTPQPHFARSLDIGAVRLTERLIRSDPPSTPELDAVRRTVTEALRSLGAPPRYDILVGIAGTVTTLAAIHGGVVPYESARIHGSTLSAEVIDGLIRTLGGMPLDARKQVPGLNPARADVIVTGAVIARCVMDWAGASSIMVSDGGVRVGLLMGAA